MRGQVTHVLISLFYGNLTEKLQIPLLGKNTEYWPRESARDDNQSTPSFNITTYQVLMAQSWVFSYVHSIVQY